MALTASGCPYVSSNTGWTWISEASKTFLRLDFYIGAATAGKGTMSGLACLSVEVTLARTACAFRQNKSRPLALRTTKKAAAIPPTWGKATISVPCAWALCAMCHVHMLSLRFAIKSRKQDSQQINTYSGMNILLIVVQLPLTQQTILTWHSYRWTLPHTILYNQYPAASCISGPHLTRPEPCLALGLASSFSHLPLLAEIYASDHSSY